MFSKSQISFFDGDILLAILDGYYCQLFQTNDDGVSVWQKVYPFRVKLIEIEGNVITLSIDEDFEYKSSSYNALREDKKHVWTEKVKKGDTFTVKVDDVLFGESDLETLTESLHERGFDYDENAIREEYIKFGDPRKKYSIF